MKLVSGKDADAGKPRTLGGKRKAQRPLSDAERAAAKISKSLELLAAGLSSLQDRGEDPALAASVAQATAALTEVTRMAYGVVSQLVEASKALQAKKPKQRWDFRIDRNEDGKITTVHGREV